MMHWIRTRLARWLLGRGPYMIRAKNHWIYVDPYEDVYLIFPTHRHADPLRIVRSS